MANNPITCPTGCSNSLVAVDPSYCNPEFLTGQIERIFLTDLNVNANFDAFTTPVSGTEVNDPVAWTTRMDQTAQAAGAIITLPVIGSKAVPEDTEVEFSQGRTRVTGRTHTVELEIDEHSDLIHDFCRMVTTCGWTGGMWYEIANGGNPKLASSDEGHHIPIEVSLKGGFEIPVERDGKVVWRLTASWKVMGTETLIDSPVPSTPEPTT